MIRKVPCMAGWDGPMLMSMLSGRASLCILDSISVLQRDQRLLFPPRVAFAQRVAFESLVHQDAAQVGVPGEGDAEHVEDLALEPVGVLPQPGERIDDRVRAGQGDLEPEAPVAAQGKKMIDHLETAFGFQEIYTRQ